VNDEFDGEKCDDAEGDSAAGDEHSREVTEAGPDDGDRGFQGMGVNDGRDGVGGVVEAVDEFETEGEA
jgi:hypothetical protein